MENIGARLKAYRKKTKVRMHEIEAAIGISKETLYKWEKGTRPSNLADYMALKSYLDRMESSLEEDEFIFETQKPATLRLPLDPSRQSIPQTSGKASAGTVVIIDNEPELIVDRINAPFLGKVEGIVEVTGESMEPTFKSGYRIAISRLANLRMLNSGECYYIIDKNWKGYVKRIYPDVAGNQIRLESDYPDQTKYPPFTRNLDDIVAIFMVTAIISRL